ncbi:MAG: hypothetical protein K2N06_05555 [Oscillospiraceae bacterium]|nr:hypothetical protein [Oscillospiraceae bacterium]
MQTKEHVDITVPYIVYEGEMARNERHIKRLIIALIVAIALIFASNLAWLIAWCQYDYSSEVIELDGGDGGNANFIGNDGDIYNGTDKGIETHTNAENRQQQGNENEET